MSADTSVSVEIRSATIFRLLLWAVGVWAFLALWRELSLCMVSVLLALAVDPSIRWLEARRYRRSAVVGGLGAATLVIVATAALLVIPPLVDQVGQLVHDYQLFEGRVQATLEGHPLLQRTAAEVMKLPRTPEGAKVLGAPMDWGKLAFWLMGSAIWIFVLTLYLLIDGRELLAWLLAYLPRQEREKAAATIPETTEVVAAYVRGQLVTSSLCGLYTGVVLSWLAVPAAVPLGMLAFVADILPVVGFLVFSVPSVLIAFTVSPATAGWVALSFCIYHALEVYVILPRVYGNKLRLSNLVVLLALMVGAVLDGVLGAILILPLVAVYPIFERIWGPDYLSDEVVEDHAALAEAEGEEKQEAVTAVLEGARPEGTEAPQA